MREMGLCSGKERILFKERLYCGIGLRLFLGSVCLGGS